jgi:hypothetical protein
MEVEMVGSIVKLRSGGPMMTVKEFVSARFSGGHNIPDSITAFFATDSGIFLVTAPLVCFSAVE